MNTPSWTDTLREQDGYHQAQAILRAIDDHQHAIERLQAYLATLGDMAELARTDRLAQAQPPARPHHQAAH